MRKIFEHCTLLLVVIVVAIFYWHTDQHYQARAAANCQPTGYMQDNINLTAASIVTASTPIITGSIDATGCNIGIYFGPGTSGTVTNAEVFGANYYGILNNGGTATVTHSRIHNIADNPNPPFTGNQHGNGIYFVSTTGNTTRGSIIGNTVYNYQKNGIVVVGSNTTATVMQNTVTGQGPINYIAQNGIEVGRGALASVLSNTVSGNAYTGTTYVATGILVYGGIECYGVPLTTNTNVTGNTVTSNDVGLYFSNLVDAACTQPATTPTRVLALSNTIRSDNNTNSYQAGITDQGDFDMLIGNHICGSGYAPAPSPAQHFAIDKTSTNNLTDIGNTSCTGGSLPAISHNKGKTESIHGQGIVRKQKRASI